MNKIHCICLIAPSRVHDCNCEFAEGGVCIVAIEL